MDATGAADQPVDGEPAEPELAGDEVVLPLLAEPADGTPEPITRSAQLVDVVAQMRTASGPIALDAERASGYRYSQRAYLVQLRRAGIGTVMIDPIALPALAQLDDAIGDAEWILHAANQDLPCLAEVGLHPQRLFDTELAGRLLGSERVALGTMVEQYLGVWLVYAALDVELLIALRDMLDEQLRAAGKDEWARQEFEAVRLAPAQIPRVDPWRRTSGIHRLRNRRQLAYVRALWYSRDEYAARHDIAPGRVLRDQAIVDAARLDPSTSAELATVAGFNGPRQRRHLGRWMQALTEAKQLPEDELPTQAGPAGDGIPPASRWADRQPEAVERLARCRAVVTELAEANSVLAQNLLASDVVRRLAWEPPQPAELASISARLAELGARAWQVELTAARLAEALT
jgi:ribonuclease D